MEVTWRGLPWYTSKKPDQSKRILGYEVRTEQSESDQKESRAVSTPGFYISSSCGGFFFCIGLHTEEVNFREITLANVLFPSAQFETSLVFREPDIL